MAKEIYQRGNILWVRFTHPGTNEQVRFSAGTSVRQEAEEFLTKMKMQAFEEAKQMGAIDDDYEVGDHLWIEAATEWLIDKRDKRTIGDDDSKLEILRPVMGMVKLRDINNKFIRNKIIKGVLAERGVSLATVNRYITLIQSILNKAERDWGLLDRAPKLAKPGKSAENSREAWLTPSQFATLIKGLPEHVADMALLAVCTGMRSSNVFKLEWRYVDLAHRRIVIPARLFKGKRDHVVPLNDTAIRVLKKHKGRHAERVFTYRGVPFERINLRHWHRACERTGVNPELRKVGLLSDERKPAKKGQMIGDYEENFVFHGLRHTFATWLARSGVPHEIIEALGGWKTSSDKTVAIYSHIADVSHLVPYSCIIDEILEGKRQIAMQF